MFVHLKLIEKHIATHKYNKNVLQIYDYFLSKVYSKQT